MKSPFHRPLRFELGYQAEIQRLMNHFFKLPSFETLGELNARLVEYAQASNFLQTFANKLATRMVTQVSVSNARSWREAATKASKGRYIFSHLKEEMRGNTGVLVNNLIRQNATYISSLPEKLAEKTTLHVQKEAMRGRRSEDIVNDLKPWMKGLENYQIQRLARTEVAKADTALTRVRAENIGLPWYQWQTSEDARVRDSHKNMDLVLVNWNDAPSPELLVKEKSEGHYHAGNIYNCRCVALPIVSLDELQWPCRVYHMGRIQRLSRKQFSIMAGLPYLVAA